jgi:hypothetical protein
MKFAVVLISLSVLPRLAHASTFEECEKMSEAMQLEQRAGRLLSSRKTGLQCIADTSCDVAVRRDCERWLKEIEAAQPSVVVRVVQADGKDMGDAVVTMDGKELEDASAGRAVLVDPGKHHFETVHGELHVDQDVIIAQGEKNRVVILTFAPPPSPPAKRIAETTRPVPLSVWILGGVGVLGLGAFTGFAIEGQAKYNRCEPTCSADAAALETRRAFAFGALGVGVVSLAIGAVLYFMRPEVAAASLKGEAYFLRF